MPLKGGYRCHFVNLPITYNSQKANFKISKSSWENSKKKLILTPPYLIITIIHILVKCSKNIMKEAKTCASLNLLKQCHSIYPILCVKFCCDPYRVAKSKDKIPCYSMILYKYNIYVCICIPKSFNTNIPHQLFEYTITFVNSQHYSCIH